jgi:argininosuccinate synthase
MEIKKDNLEKALGNEKQPEVPRDVEIGFHQGALNTLINERNELVRMIQQVEIVMQAHMKRLEELGVKIKTSEDKI